jgi:DNA mismatch endonuclease (patch repair protein)
MLVASSPERSKLMSRIRTKDTGIEVRLRKALWHCGIRYRKNYAALPGRPDIAITKHKIAVFCDGEFWHGRRWDKQQECIHSNREYWIPKIERNIERDNKNDQKLSCLGYTVLHFWGQDIEKHLDDCVETVKDMIFQAVVGNLKDADCFYPLEYELDQDDALSAAEDTPPYV